MVVKSIRKLKRVLLAKDRKGLIHCHFWTIQRYMVEALHPLQGPRRFPRRLWIYLAVAVALGALWWGRQHVRPSAKADLGWEGWYLARTVDDPISSIASSVDFMAATDLTLTMGDGSGWHGYNTIEIDSQGRCRFSFMQMKLVTMSNGEIGLGQRWRRAEFQISPQTLMDLRKLLVEIDFFRLKRGYHANVQDGTQRWARVKACGKEKRVYCNNHFPGSFQRLYTFVWEKVIEPQDGVLECAPDINLDREELKSLWYE
jgi:hypothetical protein